MLNKHRTKLFKASPLAAKRRLVATVRRVEASGVGLGIADAFAPWDVLAGYRLAPSGYLLLRGTPLRSLVGKDLSESGG